MVVSFPVMDAMLFPMLNPVRQRQTPVTTSFQVRHARKTRAIPTQLLLIVALSLLVVPVTAQTDYTCGLWEPISAVAAALLVTGYHAVTICGTLIGPLMGISSVLWLVMRNDAAIEPRCSWMVFGIWSLLTLIYFTVQCRRVSDQSLYILVTIAMAACCMCMVALVQQSSLQGGLVTAVPPCASFAAYAVAYFFPNRRRIDGWYSAV